MSDYIVRARRPDDDPRLKALWKVCFGDSDACINSFFENILPIGGCIVAEADGKVVSAMYLIRGLKACYRKGSLKVGYAYALGTLPEYRSRGIGTAVYKAVNEEILKDADAAMVVPAGPELFPFYEAAGAVPFTSMYTKEFTREEMLQFEAGHSMRVSVPQYAAMRSSLLERMSYIDFPPEIYDFLEEQGTDFMLFENALACAEVHDGVCLVHELLEPREDFSRSLGSIASWCKADRYIVRTPLFGEAGEAGWELRPYALAVLKKTPEKPIPSDLWYGYGLE